MQNGERRSKIFYCSYAKIYIRSYEVEHIQKLKQIVGAPVDHDPGVATFS
jgi:hypothetical protein